MKTPNDMMPGTILPTKKWGDVRVVNYRNAREVDIEFLDTGFKKTTRAELLRKGVAFDPTTPSVFGIGFIGDGPYDSVLNVKEYGFWCHILERCYCPNLKKKRPTYIGVYCDPQWHNFQEFAEWCQWQVGFKEEGWHLDKDCLSNKSEKVYSPETACFIPPELNGFEKSGEIDNGLPKGVYFSEYSFRVSGKDNEGRKIGKRFKTEKEALDFYTENRKFILKTVLHKFSSRLDLRIVASMKRKYGLEDN